MRFFLLALASVLLVSCASRTPTQWNHPRLSEQQMAADRSECRQRATFQVEREVTREGPFRAEEKSQVQRMFDRDDASLRQKELFDNCLRDKGYAPVVPER